MEFVGIKEKTNAKETAGKLFRIVGLPDSEGYQDAKA